MRKNSCFSLEKKTTFKWQRFFQYFLLALQFLTIIPLNLKEKSKPKDVDMANSTLFFPLVGLLIGGLLFLIYLIFNSYFSAEITSVFILGGWVYLTGALHIDGLADSIDGLSGGKDKREILDIMKDTHIGAKSTAGIILLMLIKLFLIIRIISFLRPETLIYTPALSRWGMLIGCYVVPYAREEGMGNFSLFLGYSQIVGATLITVVSGIFLLGTFFLIPLMGVGGFSLGWSFYLKRKIGGFTGDTLGALNEIGEVITLFIASLG